MKRCLVLFDIDGTLLLSGGAGRRAILTALHDMTGVSDDRLAHVRFDGKTDPEIATELLLAAGDPSPQDPARVTELLGRYVAYLTRVLSGPDHSATMMPGVRELLDRIEQDDCAVLGLLTGNVDAGAALKLRAVNLEPSRFVVGAYGSDHAVRAALPAIAVERALPHFGRLPAGREIVIIGDTPADVTCGRGVGARSIGVATGSYAAHELEAAGADFVFEDLTDVAAVHRAILDGLP